MKNENEVIILIMERKRGEERHIGSVPQRPTEVRSTGPDRDRRSMKMAFDDLGPHSVRSTDIFGLGPNEKKLVFSS